LRLGVHLAAFNFPGGTSAIRDELAEVGKAAEAAGVTRLTVMDHYFQMDNVAPADDPMLEGYTTLGYLAAHTTSVRLGLLVSGVTYRHPGLLAKIISTLDVLSGGRAELGIGAAWYEREHLGLGVPFPATAERFERLEEALRICRQMWDPDNNGPFDGKHYQLAETLNSPKTISQPRPPILIGGTGERKTLRLVAKYADACNLFASSVEDTAHKLDVLRRHCADVGRDETTIEKTILAMSPRLASGDVDGFVADMADYAELGIQSVCVMPTGDRPADWIEQNCAPAVPLLAKLAAG
jgi:F420-dependent oxidoreductase-like protein